MVYGLDYRVRNVSAASRVRSVCGLRFALSVWNFPRFGILWFDFKNGLNRRTDVLPVSVPVWCGMMVQAEFIFVRQPAWSGKIKF